MAHSSSFQDQGNSTTDDSDGNPEGPDLGQGVQKSTMSNENSEHSKDFGPTARSGDHELGPKSDRNSGDLDEAAFPSKQVTTQPELNHNTNDMKPKLGKIGGKNKIKPLNMIIPTTKATSHEIHGSDAGHVSRTHESRSETSLATASSPRGRIATPTKEPSPARETSQERANRNRERLKRELAIRSQAGIKKKRKF